jgi:molybdenum cofactor synthesis domain-containing protein
MPSAEIITIGTEILLGEIVDTNTRFLARALRGLGVDLFRTITIGDNATRIVEVIRDSMRRADIVITTGGLGPTVDDPTREAVARAVGVQTEFREDLWKQVKAVIARYGRLPTENQKRQAYIPQGAIAIENPVGTAPSFIVETPLQLPPNSPDLGGESRRDEGGRLVSIISLPGVPQEMELLFHQSVAPYLQNKFDLREVIKIRTLHTSGWSEASIDEKVDEFEELSNPTVGLAAHTGIVDIRIAAKAGSEEEADCLIASVESPIRERLGEAVFGADDDTLEGATLRAAASRGWDVVALEAGLDGSLARRFATARPANLSALEAREVGPGELASHARRLMESHSAQAALAVALFTLNEERVIEQVVITPEGEQSRKLTYGGPPKYAARWAVNLGLNWLRQVARKA